MFYKKNNIKTNLIQKGGHDNVQHNVYPSIPFFPYKTCTLNNKKQCYSNNNIIKGILYWNTHIFPKFYNYNFIKNINKIDFNQKYNNNSIYCDKKLNELENNISILIDLIVNQNIDTPCPNKYLCLHYIHKLHEKISDNNMLNLPSDWKNNVNKLCNFLIFWRLFNWLSWVVILLLWD